MLVLEPNPPKLLNFITTDYQKPAQSFPHSHQLNELLYVNSRRLTPLTDRPHE